MEHGLGGGHGEHDVGLHEPRAHAERHPGGLAELHELLRLAVVHVHPAAEGPRPRRLEQRLDLPPAEPPAEPSGDEERDAVLGHSEAVELVECGADGRPPRIEVHAGQRQLEGLDHDRRRAAADRKRLERRPGERKPERVADGGGHVGHAFARRRRPYDDRVLRRPHDRDSRAGDERQPGHRRTLAAVG